MVREYVLNWMNCTDNIEHVEARWLEDMAVLIPWLIKLVRNLDVQVLEGLCPFPQGSRVRRWWPGWDEFSMTFVAWQILAFCKYPLVIMTDCQWFVVAIFLTAEQSCEMLCTTTSCLSSCVGQKLFISSSLTTDSGTERWISRDVFFWSCRISVSCWAALMCVSSQWQVWRQHLRTDPHSRRWTFTLYTYSVFWSYQDGWGCYLIS